MDWVFIDVTRFQRKPFKCYESYATDHAVASGFGKGEFAAAIAIMRGMSVILATPIYSWAYQLQKNRGQTPRLAWFSVILPGAVIPEILHRMCTDEELKVQRRRRRRRRRRCKKNLCYDDILIYIPLLL